MLFCRTISGEGKNTSSWPPITWCPWPFSLPCGWLLDQFAPGTDTHAEPGQRPRKWRRWVFALIVCLLISSAGIYYAFFGVFFFLFAGLAGSLRFRKWTPLARASILVGTVCLGLCVNLLPCFLYQWEHGSNSYIANRASSQAERFGLNICQLVLPVTNHRIAALSHLKQAFNTTPDRTLGNDYGDSLGMMGTVGLIILLGVLVLRERDSAPYQRLKVLSLFLLAGLLLATINGLGALFAFLVSPQIRCYDRLSIFLGFLALFAVVQMLDVLVTRLRAAGFGARFAAGLLCMLLAAGGLWEQTTAANVPRYAQMADKHRTMRDFASQVQKTLPAGSMVLQLPFCHFPEIGGIYKMSSYHPFWMFLLARNIRFSHGAVLGRYGAAVLERVTSQPLDRALPDIAALGYSGIHVDRTGYPDQGQEVEAKLRSLVGVEPIVSADRRHLFFDLRAYVAKCKEDVGEEEWARREQAVRFPVVTFWNRLDGFWEAGPGSVAARAPVQIPGQPDGHQPDRYSSGNPDLFHRSDSDSRPGARDRASAGPDGHHRN